MRGNFYVTGTKSCRPRTDGPPVRSSPSSPGSYFEDFGETVLAGDSVAVDLDPDFAAMVRANSYRVFLTTGPEALYVRQRRADGFEITRVEPPAGRAKRICVGYRVVAHRADVARPAAGCRVPAGSGRRRHVPDAAEA